MYRPFTVECCILKDGGGVQEYGLTRSLLVGCIRHGIMKIQADHRHCNTVNIHYTE
jgi:hypothetical protein